LLLKGANLMKQFTTYQGLEKPHILAMLKELDHLYYECPIAAYEQQLQVVTAQVEHHFPGCTIAHAEVYTAGATREKLGSMRHVLLPVERRNAQ
jgi:hypothetical protein